MDGPWGSGKTYIWKEIKSEYLKSQWTVYVSLFGVKTASEVRSKITASIIAGSETTSVVGWTRNALTKLRVTDVASKYFKVNLSIDLLEIISKRIIICFDDLERIAPDANIEEILGLINYLSEHKSHRCLVILNETEMAPIHKEKFSKQQEKLSLNRVTHDFDVSERIDLIANSKVYESRVVDVTREFEVARVQLRRLMTRNLRAVKNIFDAILDLKRQVKRDIPESVIRFLIADCLFESEGKRNDWSFFKFNALEFHWKKGEIESDPQLQARKNFYDKYYGEEVSYIPFKSVFDYRRCGLLNLKSFSEEVFPSDDNKDQTARRILELRELHTFFFTDSELQNLRTEVESILARERCFTFAEVAILIRTLSSCYFNLENELPSSMPDVLRHRVENALKGVADIYELDRHMMMDRGDWIPSFREEISQLIDNEAIRRARVDLERAISDSDDFVVRTICSREPEVLIGISDRVDGLVNLRVIDERDYRLIYILIKIIYENRGSKTLGGEMSKLHALLMARYDEASEKMTRLRLFRLIQETGLEQPKDIPKNAR